MANPENETNHSSLAVKAKNCDIRSSGGMWIFQLSRDEWSHLKLTDAVGREFLDVAVVPLFPISASKQWVAIISAAGEEIACLDSMDGLSVINVALLEEELALREFIPHIEKILKVSGITEPCEWFVQTNHGPTNFVLKTEEDVRRISTKAVNITDANGIRYTIEDMRKLDKRSRAFVEWYV